MTRTTATVKWFDNKKGWGIVRAEDGREAFLHYQSVEHPARGFVAFHPGDRIECDLETRDQGLVARRVRALRDDD